MKRRDFLKYALGGMSCLVVGGSIPWISDNEAFGAVPVQTLKFTITDAIKDMATNNDVNSAQCYFWIYKEEHLPPESPGPMIFTQLGQKVDITITNTLDEPHAFFVPGIFDSGPIAPGQTIRTTFKVTKTGTFLYYDNLNAPVNRVMGLHGAFIAMPSRQVGTKRKKVTPYNNPTPAVQELFNDLGSKAWWPGMAWEDEDTSTDTPPFRQYIWVLHQASPNLFAEVGNYPAGLDYPAAQFRTKFLHDRFDPANPNRLNNVPQYFTISGQSGHYSHNNSYICPNNRIGEPSIIRILNAGLWTHSMHIHANHVYVIGINGVVQSNPFWVDVFTVNPEDTVDWLLPFMRPPDVPNMGGVGRADTPLTSLNGQPVWPPNEELNMRIPDGLFAGAIDLSVQLSPLCYPMHDHSEPSQGSQGGNYNMGMISGMDVTGDRTMSGGVITFPNCPSIKGPKHKGCWPPTVPF